MDRDRNLLFGVFAVQLRKATPTQLVDVAAAWATDPSRSLGARLVEANVLSEADKTLLDGLVAEAIRNFGGDASRTLEAFGGEEEVNRSFQGSIVLTDEGVETPPKTGVPVEEVDSVPAVQEAPGRYSHISEHARGGMGRVLLVHDQYLGRDVALKELLLPAGSDVDPNRATPVRLSMQMMARFLQESRITGQLEHPAIVPVYEIGHRKNGTLYYTMKLVRGRTLTKAIKDAETLRARLALLPHFVDLCQAIAYAHSRGVIHRDIKPDNVMVGEFGETVVLDWGLAKAHNQRDVHADGLAETLRVMNLGDEAEAVKTSYGHAIGTPAYMPPEQAKGNLDLVTERSDVYSLGAVLYELLTGHPPFEGGNLFALLNSVLNNQPTSITTRETTAPPELVAICQQAMHKNPNERYASAKELAEEIQRFQSGALVQSYDYGLRDLLRRFVRKHKAILATATAAGILLLVLGAVSYVRIMQERDQAIMAREDEIKAREEVERQQEETRRQLYRLSIMQAKTQQENNLYHSARNTFWNAPIEYANWEWGHVANALYPSLVILHGHKGWITSVSFNPDGKCLATTSDDGTARIWDATTAEELLVIEHDVRVWCASFSPDGKRLYTGTRDRLIHIWDSETGEKVSEISGHGMAIYSISFSSDGKRFLTASADRTARVWDTETNKEIITITGHGDRVWSACFSPDDAYILTASQDGTARIWDAITGCEVAVLRGHGEAVWSATYSPDGSQIVTASFDRTARVWNAKTEEEILTLKVDEWPVWSAVFSPDGKYIMTTSADDIVRIWDANSGNEHSILENLLVRSAVFSPDGKRIVTISYDWTTRIWKNTTTETQNVLTGHQCYAFSALFSPDGSRIVTASNDWTACIWDAVTGEALTVFTGHGERVFFASFSPDGSRIATASQDCTARIWNSETGENQTVFTGHEGDVRSASFSPDGSRVVTASHDWTARIWNAATGDEQIMLIGHNGPVLSASFSPDGKRILTASTDATARIWDADTGEKITNLVGHGNTLSSANFSPDGKRIVTASNDCTARIWDVESGKEMVILAGHELAVWSASFSPDGTRILTASTDATARIWDSVTGDELLTLRHNGRVANASFSPDGTRIATSEGWLRPIRIWDATPWKMEGFPEVTGDYASPMEERTARFFEWKRRNYAEWMAKEEQNEKSRREPLQWPSEFEVESYTTKEAMEWPLYQLQHIKRIRGKAPAGQPGFILEECSEAGPLNTLGIELNAHILTINGQDISCEETFLATIEAFRIALKDGEATSFQIVHKRESRRERSVRLITHNVIFRDIKIEQKEIAIPRDFVLMVINMLTDAYLTGDFGLGATNTVTARSLGEPETAVSIIWDPAGIWGDNAPAINRLIELLGVRPGDRFCELNGEMLTNFEMLFETGLKLIEEIRMGNVDTIKIAAQRNAFVRVETTITLTD